MLEAIRLIVLERMNKLREISRKWNPGVCPNIKKRLEWLKEQQRFWHVIPAGGNLFEVRSGSKGFTVDEGKRTYSCRMWRLSGIHCIHATKVIFLINRVPESYVPAWFEIDMYFVTYHNYVKLVPGMNLWPDQSIYFTVLPPKPRKTSVDDVEDVDVVQRGPVRDEGDGGSRGGARGSRGGFSVFSGASGSTGKGAGGSGGASGSRGRGAAGSKRKLVSTAGTQKDKVRRRFRLLDLLNGLDCKMNQSRHKINHIRLIMNQCRHKMKTKWSRHKNKLR
ncbi:hypothetical protein Tco_1567719 [Tanacetum coccineum]